MKRILALTLPIKRFGNGPGRREAEDLLIEFFCFARQFSLAENST